jgi:hypothetical protein
MYATAADVGNIFGNAFVTDFHGASVTRQLFAFGLRHGAHPTKVPVPFLMLSPAQGLGANDSRRARDCPTRSITKTIREQ